MANSGGVNRDHHSSLRPKLTFAAIHAGLIAICLWLAFGGFNWPDPFRAKGLALCALLYFARHLITLFVLLKRRLELSEALGLSGFMALFEIGFLVLGTGILTGTATPIGGWDWLGVALLLIGSYLNTGSEMQRWVWKKKPETKGHCYTGGLFAYSLHINYFGDTLLFSGWALLTASLFAWPIPIFVTLGFIFFHIPPLDIYLAERYGEEFKAYAVKTAKFIPFVY